MVGSREDLVSCVTPKANGELFEPLTELSYITCTAKTKAMHKT